MKIKDIKFSKENLDLIRPYTISYKTVTAVENLILEITLENGMYGMGASNPSKYVVGQDVNESFQDLQQADLDWLIGRDIRTMHQLCFEVKQKFAGKIGIITAFDLALHDAFSKYLDIPLVKYLGQKMKELPTSITIGIKNVEETLKEAQEYIDREFSVLKVKLGASLEEDLERLVKLREVYGSSVTIRIDANQGYSVEDLIVFHEKTKNLEIELVEQPLKANQIEEMKSLPEEIRKTIAADESLVGTESALSLVSGQKACGIFNIKLMKCGGVTYAKEICTIAENSGIDLMWGCNDESIISISAALHASFSSASTKYIDLDGSLDLAKDVVSGGFTIEKGWMRMNGKAGLGVEKL